MTGRIHSVETFGALDGPGIRYVVFLQGCPLRCLYCHNPDTWDTAGGGKEMTAEELLKDILRYRSFIDTGGVTLSGGEPLMQAEFCAELIRLCRKEGLHTAIDTSGSVPLYQSREALDLCDLVLLDIKALDPSLCHRLTGQDNQTTLETLDYCEKTKKKVWIRHVLVPGYTLDESLLHELAEFLSDYRCIERVELLPFHKMGEYKWEELGRVNALADTPPPTKEQNRLAREIFSSCGLPLK